jgi:hypothetical protein
MERVLVNDELHDVPLVSMPDRLIVEGKPWFRLATMLGEGENCAVFSLGHAGQDVIYTDSEDSDSDSEHSCSSCCSGDEDSHSITMDVDSECSDRAGESGEEEEVKEVELSEHTADSVHFQVEDVRVHGDTSMGRVQLVAKVFQHLDEDVGYALYDKSEDKFLKWFCDEEEAGDYMRRRNFTSPRFDVQEVVRHEDERTIRLCDFQHEALSNLLLSKLVDKGLTPHITLATGAVSYKNTGYLLLERVDGTMDDLLSEERLERRMCDHLLTVPEIAGLFFQTVYGLHVMQHVCQLKHHDLHTGNVFVQRITRSTRFKEQQLQGATHFHYHLDGTDFYIPNCGVLAKLGDFAMASFDYKGKRVQRVDMDAFNDNPEKWGYWNAHYENERGYDTQFLFADVPVDGRLRKSSALHRFLKLMKAAAMGKRGRVTPKKFRPLAGHVSNVPAASVLMMVFHKKVAPDFNFLTRPDPATNPVIVTLGHSDWL